MFGFLVAWLAVGLAVPVRFCHSPTSLSEWPLIGIAGSGSNPNQLLYDQLIVWLDDAATLKASEEESIRSTLQEKLRAMADRHFIITLFTGDQDASKE